MKTQSKHNKMQRRQNCLLLVDGILTLLSVCVFAHPLHLPTTSAQPGKMKLHQHKPWIIANGSNLSRIYLKPACGNKRRELSCNHFAFTVTFMGEHTMCQARTVSANAKKSVAKPVSKKMLIIKGSLSGSQFKSHSKYFVTHKWLSFQHDFGVTITE